MAYRGDDLTPVLAPPPGAEVGLRQGKVLSWNAQTGENAVEVGGTVLYNVPVLSGNEAVALKAGHVVIIQVWKSNFWILGRVLVPGTSDFAPSAVEFGVAPEGEASNFAVGTSEATGSKLTKTISVPAWADEALVFCVGTIGVNNNLGSGTQVLFRVEITSAAGVNNGSTVFEVPAAGAWTQLTAAETQLISNPGSTITLDAVCWAAAALAANANNGVSLEATCVFRSVT